MAAAIVASRRFFFHRSTSALSIAAIVCPTSSFLGEQLTASLLHTPMQLEPIQTICGFFGPLYLSNPHKTYRLFQTCFPFYRAFA
ncbi:MAG: hypothetical protein WAN35_10860 [Terracidiphilus sp.]